MTIPELFYNTIMRSFEKMVRDKVILVSEASLKLQQDIMNNIQSNTIGQLKNIVFSNLTSDPEDESAKKEIEELVAVEEHKDEEIKVTKKGVEQTVKIDSKKNNDLMKEVNRIFSKDNVNDMFQEMMVSDPN